MNQVQCLKLFSLNPGHGAGDVTPNRPSDDSTRLAEVTTSALTVRVTGTQTSLREVKQPQLFLVSGSLDNTVKLWGINTGKVVRTLIGILKVGNHDRTIKVSEKNDISSFFFHIGRCHAILDMGSRDDTCRRSSVTLML